MRARTYEDDLDAVRRAAAGWAERARSGDLAPQDRATLRAWLAEDPAHELEFELAEGLLASEELRVALAESAAESARPAAAGGFGGGFGVGELLRGLYQSPAHAVALSAALVLTAGAGALVGLRAGHVGFDAGAPTVETASLITTPPGEALGATLSDGSRVELNGGTTLAVTIAGDRREVEVRRGDASFEVAHDATRPFTVRTETASATALGTVFTVSRFEETTVVSVLEGTVRVAGRGEGARSVDAEAGARVAVDADAALETSRFDPAGAEDWRSGWLDTTSIRLGDLADLMWRRTGRRVYVAEPVADLEISGRFRIDDPDAALRSLARLHGLEVVGGASGVVVRGGSARSTRQ